MLERYVGQIGILGVGVSGQKRLSEKSVLVVGTGGLGSVLLYCLSGAGIGRVGFADYDKVRVANLNRQFLFTEKDLDRLKTEVAFEKLSMLNSEISLNPINKWVTTDNVDQLVDGYDLVIAAADNQATRIALNEACCKKDIPLINGGIDGMYGMIQMVIPGKTPCLSCQSSGDAGTTTQSLGSVVSVVSSLMAQATILYLLGEKVPFAGKLGMFDGRSLALEWIGIYRDPDCPVCSDFK